jgi:pantoate--beta-alanine ligase
VKRVTTIAAVRDAIDDARRGGSSIGLVPTMGYLHEGHLSLMRRAVSENGFVVATIFVNPLQFGAGEDLSSYPRDPEGDAAKALSAGVSLLFSPPPEEMYPGEVHTSVQVAGVSSAMEGASRPTHFAGVATVVAKIFSIVGKSKAYFGEKDYQQLAVIRTMTADLSIPVDVIGCPIVREPDGLAMSSRNAYLDPTGRAAAPILRRALRAGADAIADGERDGDAVRDLMRAVVAEEPLAQLDYVEVADPVTLEPLARVDEGTRLFGAVRIGTTRLIDNCAVFEGEELEPEEGRSR